tara:strand:- start:4662 stop:6359 length:1698 start_codon:yes stop_codon:yes gene_type:complete
MIKKRLRTLKRRFSKHGIDGYVIPKNDEFFSEYSNKDRLKTISNFSGSAGYAVVLKNKNYLFVDGRYSIQAKIEAGDNFIIKNLSEILNCKLFKNITLGIDPKIFTSDEINKFFLKFNKIKIINLNLVDEIYSVYPKNIKPFYSLKAIITGESYKKKINRVSNFLKKEKLDYLFVSASENVAWLLNIRGYDNPNSPLPNCHLVLTKGKKFFLICEKKKLSKLIKEKKVANNQIINPKTIISFLSKIKIGKFIVDSKTCSIFYRNIIVKNHKIVKNEDPIYLLKSIKNKHEIDNIVNAHIDDGVALTKFLYWIKTFNRKKITEVDAQNKLEIFRKKSKKYLFPSFNTIAGSGKNGAIIHYRATKKNTKIIDKKELFLCDSGGQYKYGTTDVTRTICFSKPSNSIKNIFTKVLKGHIAVVTSNLKTHYNGKLIDKRARASLLKSGLNYNHGTGHGVGFFSNVHEGPQAISKFNTIKLKEGMILSNEPGYYKKGKFGIRIENLVYIKKNKKKLYFVNLTMAPIDKDLINFDQLSKEEKNYLYNYHLNIYLSLSNYLNKKEKKWLASFI